MSRAYDYEYEWDINYCYPDSKVLKNKFNIQDAEKLNELERRITAINILEIKESPLKGKLDLKHLLDIHKYIFGDIYEWAGKFRAVNIAKGNLFCNCMYLDTYATNIFQKLQSENYLIKTAKEYIPERLTYYLSEINVMHPFREGNGRTQRVFIEYLAQIAGFRIDFSSVSSNEMIEASVKAFDYNYDKMNDMFKRIISPITIEEQQLCISEITGARSHIMRIFKSI